MNKLFKTSVGGYPYALKLAHNNCKISDKELGKMVSLLGLSNEIGLAFCLIQKEFQFVKLNSDTYYVDFVAININWLYVLYLNMGTFFICSIMLLLPTLIITKLTPIKTLKFD